MAVKNKVEANTAYRDVELNYNVVELLRIIKEITFKSSDKSTTTNQPIFP